MKVLVTGSAGFIGSHVTLALLARGDEIVGIDNLNAYYDVRLKQARLEQFVSNPGYTHLHADIGDREAVEVAFAAHRPESVIHLAAQPGVRYAAVNPHAYVSSNVTGFLHVLEGCRHHGVGHLVFASTSSVYGANRSMPYAESQPTEHPLTLYAATKKADEMMAHAYAHLYGIPSTSLRFFTVYGPWGRPDMAPMLFAKAICGGEPIGLFGGGGQTRSFTYIDDIVESVIGTIGHPAERNSEWDAKDPDPASSNAPYRVYNIGHPRPVRVRDFVKLLEQALGRTARTEILPPQPGDLQDTEADTGALCRLLGHAPRVPVEEGVPKFASWYLAYQSQ